MFDGEKFIGGVTGFIKSDWLYVKELILGDAYRGKGLGYKLMKKAEEYACKKGVFGMYLKTFSYQAPEFYKKCGFEIVATFYNMPKGHQTHILQKKLL